MAKAGGLLATTCLRPDLYFDGSGEVSVLAISHHDVALASIVCHIQCCLGSEHLP